MGTFYKLGKTQFHTGRTTELPAAPENRNQFFWDWEQNKLYGATIDLTWILVATGSLPTTDPNTVITIANFNYATSSPLLIKAVSTNEYVNEVKLVITTVFDGTVTLKVSDPGGSNDRLMKTDENDPTTLGVYSVSPEYTYAGPNNVNLYLSVAGSTQGAGQIVLITGLL